MRKIILSIVVLQMMFSTAFSQKIDTTLKNPGLKNKIFSADSAHYAGYEFAKSSPFNIDELMPAKFSKISLGTNYEKGHLMTAQNATKLTQVYLATEGNTKLKSVNLWGAFKYERSVEDSTMYNHQTRNNISAPYYYGSPINLNYERTLYNLKALAEKNLIKTNLPVGIGGNYRIGNHFSTNDPRGSVDDFQLNMIATLGYTLFEKLKIGAAYRYGYGQERVNVAYKNQSLSQNTLKPEYNNYLVNGYGEAYVFNTNRTYQNDQKRSGFETYLNFTKSAIGNFFFTYSYLEEKQKFVRRSGEGFADYNDYNLETSDFSLFWLKKIGNKNISTSINYNNIDGKDLNYIYMANNYLYNHNSLSFRTNLSITSSKGNLYNFYISANQNEEQKQDGLTGNNVKYNRLDWRAGFGYTKTTIQSNVWGVSLSGVYSVPLTNRFDVPGSNVGQFTQKVIYFDYIYNTSTRLGGSLSADYSFEIFNQVQAGFKASAAYLNKQKIVENTFPFAPGKDRFSSNISLNLYF
ncbi:hypothetical protein EA772_00285 [Pedobacter sp. G11]|uniref:DUF6850 family outer membrane beta-barrel protein n=1 Tax=Pedobacter sp. G11 TaxID=2482728 RepID=UPI000F5D9598|nr:DUF6850 family outer membrane beta-barrel protein [Pedobacter sp. G11]AZI23856.1 hypothetical protein EA772_00285 [Pedobacter sp. G11]